MEEVGQHQVNALTTLCNLEWLQQHIGKNTLISAIGENLVAQLVARRRQDFRKVGRAENRTKKVGNATVNRTCTEPLRKVLIRANSKWDCHVQKIDWSSHMLTEPKERIREASPSEEAAVMDQLSRGNDTAVEFAILTGCRRMEIVGLTWNRVDFFNRQFTVIGKNSKERTIPMSNIVFELLWNEQGYNPQWVFTYEAQRTDKLKERFCGLRYRITDAGLRTAMRRAVAHAGIENLHFHDMRHTAATRVLRKSNLRVVQTLLGHSDPATTAKYAHVMSDDLRAAMDAVNPLRLPADEIDFRIKSLKGDAK
jgi:integrase